MARYLKSHLNHVFYLTTTDLLMEAPKVRHKARRKQVIFAMHLECRALGAHHLSKSDPDLTVGPIKCRPFGPHECVAPYVVLGALESPVGRFAAYSSSPHS